MGHAPTIFLSAGEPSGDMHGALLARALRARLPGVRLIGLGGDQMRAEGVELLADLHDLAVMGFAEVIRHLPFFVGLRRRVWASLDAERVDLVVPIDYPGFNLRLARHAHRRGTRVLYYIAPQVWAWHRSRARDLARDTDAIAVVLPFEEAFLRSAGAPVRFVGHPLLDQPPLGESRADWLARHDLDPDRPLLALFPGSRRQELRRHLGLFAETAARAEARRPGLQTVIAAAPGMEPGAYAATSYPRIHEVRALLAHASAALVKSGTTTLQAGIAGTPMVVAYRMAPSSYAVARRLVSVPHIALANLILDERVVPEFIQGAATPQRLCDALLPLLDRTSAERAAMRDSLARIPRRLGGPGASQRVAEMAAGLLSAAEASR